QQTWPSGGEVAVRGRQPLPPRRASVHATTGTIGGLATGANIRPDGPPGAGRRAMRWKRPPGSERSRAPRAWVPTERKGRAMHEPPIPHLAAEDPQLAALIEGETQRQHDKLRMIPSENYVSVAVMEACGTVLNNKYSEGYATKRYYEGQQFI